MRIAGLLVLFMALAAGAQTLSEKIQSLQDFKTNQDNFNRDEHARNDQERIELESRIDKRLEAFSAAQAVQDADMKSLDGAATKIEFLGVIVIVVVIPLGVYFRNREDKRDDEDSSEQDKAHRAMAADITALNNFKLRTELQIPLLTNVVDRLSSVLVEGVHHPDDTHMAADTLLDKLPSSVAPSLAELSHDDHAELTSLLRERSADPDVTARERNMAKQLMPVLDAVRQLRELEKQTVKVTEAQPAPTTPGLKESHQ